MTILEMLDRLEAEILSLREAQSSAVPGSQSARASETPARSPRTRSKTKSRAKKSKKSTQKRSAASARSQAEHTGEEQQLALPVEATGDGETAPVVGKRRALGRSLLHLRELAKAARESSSS